MTSTATVPTTIQLRPSRLVGLLLAAVALAAAVTWAVTVFAVDTRTDDDQDGPAAAVSQQITPHQIAAAYVDVYKGREVSPTLRDYAQATVAAGLSESTLDLIDGPVGPAVGGAGAFIPQQGVPTAITANPSAAAEVGGAGAFIPPQG